MKRVNLDMDLLRTLVTARQLGSFNRAASRLGRSQSAISQQMRKLEEQLGERLFQKEGRGWALTEAGEVVLAYARRILELNDEAVSAVREHTLDGEVRFGCPADFAESWLPGALARFKLEHPTTRVEVAVDRNRMLLERLDAGELDLVLALANDSRADAELVSALQLLWIGAAAGAGNVINTAEPVQLAMFEAPCFFRQGALTALDRAGLPWRIAFTSPSLSGLWAAVSAGLGITLRTAVGLPAGVKPLTNSGLPSAPQPSLNLCLHNAGRSLNPATSALRAIVLNTLRHQSLVEYQSERATPRPT
jgi:DNA-binding transcriptional LysR family regulator